MQFVRQTDCPGEWEYERHPDYSTALPARTHNILITLRRGYLDTLGACTDTRSPHYELFQDVTPDGFDYFAGHYRGEDFECLKFYEVGIQGDNRVGLRADTVFSAMKYFSGSIEIGVRKLDQGHVIPHAILPKEQKIVYIVTFACRIFVEFLRIHPYANGNGHMGRFIIYAILGRFGFWPKKWPLNQRPPDPPYTYLISDYRNGNRVGLENFVLKCILGEA